MYQENEFRISESEWLIMHAVWIKQQPLYMGEIVKALTYTPWSRTTIQTMVARLVQKGVLGSNKTGYAFLYYPLVTKEDAMKAFTASFIKRVYANDALALVAEIVNSDYLTIEEKKTLKKLL